MRNDSRKTFYKTKRAPLFVQQVAQADAEGVVAVEAKMVRLPEWMWR